MKLKSAVAVAALRAAGKRLGIDMSANSSVLKMAAELGYFLIQSEINDNVIAARDTTGVSDDYVHAFFKTLTDTPSVAEEATRDFYKVLADTTSVSEVQVMDFYKSLADSVGLTDNIDTVDFGKILEDVSELTDAHNYDLGKSLSDAFSVSESLYRQVDFTRAFLDNSVSVDTFVRQVAFTRGFSDASSIAESNYVDFSKPLTENSSISDDIDTVEVGKNLSDTPSASDNVDKLETTKLLTDTVGITDDVDGAASIQDDQEMQFTKIRTDVGNVAENFTRQVDFSRAFTDSNEISESLAHSFGKLFTNTSNVSESIALQIGLALPDEASLTDAGSYRSQGYCDFAYFAEDYVGASGTF